MHLRFEAYQRVTASKGRRAMLFIVLGAIGVVGASFTALLGILMMFMTDGGVWENRGGLVLGIFFGVFPLIGAALLLWRGIVRRTQVGHLRELSALARHRPAFTSHDIREAIGLSAQNAEKLVLDALTLGILEEDAPGSPAFAATVVASTPPPERVPSGIPPGSLPQPGSVLNGTYRIEGPLGAGGMGAVFAARHLRTGRAVAVKVLLPDTLLSPDAIRRFEREATAASALGHPGIIAVHDFDETAEGMHYLVMDLLRGETLEQRLVRAGSLPWASARKLAVELGSALAAAHEGGLLHRDLKPANIFLVAVPGAEERPVLLDFGLVKPIEDRSVSRITRTGAAVGTPTYMSPEQARGEPLDARSDVYSLAAVLYEIVTGAPPFLDSTLAAVYARLLTESAPSASSMARYPVPAAVDAALACALAKAPSQRFADVRSFVQVLASIQPLAVVEPRTA